MKMIYEPVKKGVSKSYPDLKKNESSNQTLLKVRTANESIADAMKQAIPRQLCSNLWFEGEVAILFADTNLGKSILAVQIADLITRGRSENNLSCLAEAQLALYLDFEMSDKQFENRYSMDYKRHYSWDPKLIRMIVNPTFTDYKDFENTLFENIESEIERLKAKVLIVDNITFLKMQSTEKGNEAMALMKRLIQLKHKYGLSLLILAHTPKRQDQSLPLTLNDLAGSKQLSNFADSIFCIGKSIQGPDGVCSFKCVILSYLGIISDSVAENNGQLLQGCGPVLHGHFPLLDDSLDGEVEQF